MVLRRTVCGEAVERSAGRRRTVDPSPFHTQERESPLPPRARYSRFTDLHRILAPMTDLIPRLNTALEGRYAIEREIAVGGMATVYLAQDLKHNRNVALKVLKPELAAVVGAERPRHSFVCPPGLVFPILTVRRSTIPHCSQRTCPWTPKKECYLHP